MGRTLHLRYGHENHGRDVAVVAEGPCEWVVRQPDGRFTVIDRRQRGAILFDSAAAAARSASAAVTARQRRRDEYRRLLAEQTRG